MSVGITRTRSQSAMEYLMTYGWAILIIAVILGVLFSLGVFNPTNYAPKVPAGNCHVFRPNGPGTNFNVNLVGTCSGFLPQYVAQFNGASSQISVSSLSLLRNSITFTAWVYDSASVESEIAGIVNSEVHPYITSGGSLRVDFYWDDGGHNYYGSGQTLTKNTWYFVAVTYDGTDIRSWVDSSAGTVVSASNSLSTVAGPVTFGIGEDGYWLKGSLANVQLYNASLDANEIQYLYNEGIGGSPVYLSHLVGWWPLNGDTKDYSGNGYDGTPTNIAFNGSWTVGYASP